MRNLSPTKTLAALAAGLSLATSLAPALAQPAPASQITSAGFIIGGMISDRRDNMYAGAENVTSLEVCKNFGLAVISNFVSAHPPSGNLMCFDANKLVIAKFVCKGTETFRNKPAIPAHCTPVPTTPALR